MDPPVPTNLADWWFKLSVLGTAISVILLIMDIWCCTCGPKDVYVQTCSSQWVFLATLFEDLPLLTMSLVTLKNLPSDVCEGFTTDIAKAFTISSIASLVVSLFRLLKLYVLCCPTCNECTQYCLGLLHISTSILSVVVLYHAVNFAC